MKRSTRIVKRLLALFLVVLMSIESFGTVVSDNDGSAFITKAEFDSLKSDFQKQIDQYNSSIDSKLDGTVAAYLAGIRIKIKNTNDSNIEELEWPIRIVERDAIATERIANYKTAPVAWQPEQILRTTVAYGADINISEFVSQGKDRVGYFLRGSVKSSENGTNDIFVSDAESAVIDVHDQRIFLLDNYGDSSTTARDYIPTDTIRGACYIDYRAEGDTTLHTKINEYTPSTNTNRYVWFNDTDNLGEYNNYESTIDIVNDGMNRTFYALRNLTKTDDQTLTKSSIDFDNRIMLYLVTNSGKEISSPRHFGSAFANSQVNVHVPDEAVKEKINRFWNGLGYASYNTAYFEPVCYDVNKTYDAVYMQNKKNLASIMTWNRSWHYRERTARDDAAIHVKYLVLAGWDLIAPTETGSTRPWYERSLIEPSRIYYNFTVDDSDTTINNIQAGSGVPVYCFGKDADTVKMTINVHSNNDSVEKYAYVSIGPLKINQYNTKITNGWSTASDWYAQFMPTDTSGKQVSGQVWSDDATLEFNFSDVKKGDVIYFNCYWNNDGNLNEITIDNPWFDISSEV